MAPFFGKEAEPFGGVGGGGGDEGLEVDFASSDAVGVEEVDAVFHAGDAVGNEGEVGSFVSRRKISGDCFLGFGVPHVFLGREVEGGVVGSDGVDGAVGKFFPEESPDVLWREWGGDITYLAPSKLARSA